MKKKVHSHYVIAVVITVVCSLFIVLTSATRIALPDTISTLEVVFYMNITTALFFFIYVKIKKKPILFHNIRLLTLRSAMGFVGVYLFFLAYDVGLSLSAGVVISRLVPIFSVVGMIVLMKEKIIGEQRFFLPLTLLIAMVAVVVIANPFSVGASEGVIPVTLAVASGVLSGITMVVIFKLMATDKPELVGLFNALFVVVIGFFMMLITKQFRILALEDYLLLLLLGFFNALTVFTMALSTVFASPTKTAPYSYFSVVFAPIVQFVLFGSIITGNVIIGAILIIIANIIHFYVYMKYKLINGEKIGNNVS